jgi:flagellar basal body-associated protein FliL
MENEAKDDKGAEQTSDVNVNEGSKDIDTDKEAVNRAVTDDSKDTNTGYVNTNKEAVNKAVTEDSKGPDSFIHIDSEAIKRPVTEDASTDKKNVVNFDLKNKLIMAIVALISIVCSFAFVSKISTSFEENDFEVQDVNSVSTAERTKDVPQRETSMKQENKKAKTNDVNRAGVEKGNADDINSDEEAGSLMDVFVVPLESIVVNLGGIGSNRYLRIQISLGVDSEDVQKKISEKTVILRDKMISFFSTKTVKAVETEGGLFKLRLEIKALLNKLLGSGDIIKQVYFSDFIVQ